MEKIYPGLIGVETLEEEQDEAHELVVLAFFEALEVVELSDQEGLVEL